MGSGGVFWVHRGRVSLIGIGTHKFNDPPQRWADMTEAPAHHPQFHFWGPLRLLGKPTTAFLCSTRCPAEKVAEIYECARQQCDTGGTVISG